MRLCCPCLGILLLAGGVSCAATPHQGGLYRAGVAESNDCSHVVHLLTAEQMPSAYRELAQVSATCPYVSPRTCERILLSRACELEADAVVAERLEEGNELGSFIDTQIETPDVIVDAALRKVTPTIVELDDLFERGLTAVVKVGAGELYVAQAWSFEGPSEKPDIFSQRGDPSAEEPGIPDRIIVVIAIVIVAAVETADAGKCKFSAGMAGATLRAPTK